MNIYFKSFLLSDDLVSAGVTSSQQDLMLYIDHLSNLCLEREPQELWSLLSPLGKEELEEELEDIWRDKEQCFISEQVSVSYVEYCIVRS